MFEDYIELWTKSLIKAKQHRFLIKKNYGSCSLSFFFTEKTV
jgi:hypothetical protein